MPQDIDLFDTLHNRQNQAGGGAYSAFFTHTYHDIISIDNLLLAWREFIRGKRNKHDVQEFQHRLMDNILALHIDLREKTYQHGPYHHFKVHDPKPRDIHKASVRDRLLHHAIHRILYPYYDRTFIADSYSCRNGKGTYKALQRFRLFTYRVSKNNTRTCYILKCDIRKFFASIDHDILIQILQTRIPDTDILHLLADIIHSFPKGLPLGNLTSQLLVNIYMNEFDQYMKHVLKATYYIRYADDFVILHHDKNYLETLLVQISNFLTTDLHLQLHPNKVFITTVSSGVDFLGWIHFPHHRVLRTSTKRRMLKRAKGLEVDSPTVQSYVGMLRWGNGYKLQKKIQENLVTTA